MAPRTIDDALRDAGIGSQESIATARQRALTALESGRSTLAQGAESIPLDDARETVGGSGDSERAARIEASKAAIATFNDELAAAALASEEK